MSIFRDYCSMDIEIALSKTETKNDTNDNLEEDLKKLKLKNEEEIKKLIDEDYQELLAEGIVEGILSHYEKVKVPDRRELAEKMVAKEVGEEKAKEYIDEVWE